ncbi:MAG: DNA recombination protein RmuC [Alphaproteobacteria bacterium]
MDAIFYIIMGFIPGAAVAVLFFVKLNAGREESIRSEVEKDSLERQLAQHKDDLEKIETRFKEQFENLANRIFDKKSETFKSQSQESLGLLLNPLKEKLMEFQKKVDDSFGKQMSEQFSLKNEIKNIVDVSQKVTLQAENLANALKGNTKTQGDWGEVILENILEASGLRKGENYIVQGSGLGLKHADTGQSQRPDVIVNLPDGKHVIIDSKVSLTHYEKFWTETDEALRSAYLKQFLDSVKKHALDLEQRRYQDTDKLGTPEIVLMFMPIEGAFMLAVQEDRALHGFAWSKNVAIVCPSTLFATLKTISSLWRLVRQNQNAQEIARQGGALYDKIEGFVDDMQGLGKQIQKIESTYEDAMSKLSKGKGNILSRTEKLKKLGATTPKSLPMELFDHESDDDETIFDLISEEKKRA